MASCFGLFEIPGTEGISWKEMGNGLVAVTTGHDIMKENEVMANIPAAREYESNLNNIANKIVPDCADACVDAAKKYVK